MIFTRQCQRRLKRSGSVSICKHCKLMQRIYSTYEEGNWIDSLWRMDLDSLLRPVENLAIDGWRNLLLTPQAIRRPGSASSSSTTSDDMPLLVDVASDDELQPLEELPPTPDDVIYCTTSLGGGVRIVAGATRVAAMRFAAEQMFTQMLQQRGSERLLPSLDIAPQANATPEQQCTRCPYHERALVEREVERLLTTVLGSRHVREPRQFLRRILHRILELV